MRQSAIDLASTLKSVKRVILELNCIRYERSGAPVCRETITVTASGVTTVFGLQTKTVKGLDKGSYLILEATYAKQQRR